MLTRTEDKITLFMGDDATDVAHWLEQTPRQWRQKSSMADGRSHHWDLSAGYDGAVRLAAQGWSEGVKQVDDVLRVGFKRAQERAPRVVHDVAGHLPDVGRYLSGDPLHMIHSGRDKGAGSTMHIIINTVCSAATRAEQFINYGAAIVAMIDELENSGKRVHLDVASVFNLNRRIGVFGWTVKQSRDALDIGAVAFAISHPAAFRRLQFAMAERTPRSMESSSYGTCGNLTNEIAAVMDAPHALLMNGVGENAYRGRSLTLEDASALAREQLERAEQLVRQAE